MQASSENSIVVDPTDIASVNQWASVWAGPRETIHPVEIDRIVIADNAMDALAEILTEYAGGGVVLMVVDRTLMRRGDDDLKPQIFELLAKRTQADICTLPEQAGGEDRGDCAAAECYAEFDAARQLAGRLGPYSAVLAVGSGSVTDVAKYARHLHTQECGRGLPFVSLPTAPSVTAYTSALAVLTLHGVKRTFPARPPNAVVCDLRALADAPVAMIQAGFGDVIARGVSAGDWYLAHQLGMDDGYSHVPGRLLDGAERAMIARAEGVATGQLDAVRAVTEAMLLAGMAMSLVNKTAPLSGWEHVISHFLDLSAKTDGRRLALHGGQVGVAVIASARAYERAWDEADLDRLTVDRDARRYRTAIENVLRPHDSSGGMTAEVWQDYEKKLRRWQSGAKARRAFVARCRAGEVLPDLRGIVRSSREISEALRRAAAPRRFADLDRPVNHSSAVEALLHGHLIRARFTFGDLLAESGWLSERHVDELLDGPAE